MGARGRTRVSGTDHDERPLTVLLADDDPDDCLLIADAFKANRFPDCLVTVSDGEELMDYLHCRGKYGRGDHLPRPRLIILDLNMPRKDGREVLREVKRDPRFKRIPIVVFTTSGEREDVNLSYELGANSFLVKPVSFDGLREVIRVFGTYWFDLAELPKPEDAP